MHLAPRDYAEAGKERKRQLARALFLLFLGLFLAPNGCNRERRHEILTFFFDGVPALDAVPEAAQEISPQYMGLPRKITGPLKPKAKYHEPFRKQECSRCHPRAQSMWLGLGFDRRGGCLKCHEHSAFKQRLNDLRLLHGPVAVSNCLVCHSPHESIHDFLLVAPDPELCYGCHERDAVVSSPAHADWSDEKCLACHDPHGGDKPFFLRKESEL